jgi:hypothetical protein
MNNLQEFIDKNLPNASNYQKFLVKWIIDIGIKNKESFNYNNIKDIAIGVYLLCKDLKLDPSTDDTKFIEYFTRQYGYGSLVHKLVLDIVDSNPDLLDLLSQINDTEYNNEFMSSCDFRVHLETLYNTEKISEEENRETLIFGDNLLNGEMTTRELSDTVRMMTEEYVSEYITELNLGNITFNISENSIMYLKDTDGIKLAIVNIKDKGNRYVIRYTNEQGSALFLLFEPALIKTETIYGLSLDSENDEERGLLILEKDKDDSVYRFLFGRDEF